MWLLRSGTLVLGVVLAMQDVDDDADQLLLIGLAETSVRTKDFSVLLSTNCLETAEWISGFNGGAKFKLVDLTK